MKILAISGSRADWGLLEPILKLLDVDPRFHLEILITGQHLTEEANSLNFIKSTGLSVDHIVDMKMDSHAITCELLCAATGLICEGVGRVLGEQRPDLVLVLGDRYEIHGAVIAALLSRVPVAHIAGGDVTEGAFDDAIRHSITKIAALHFATNDVSAARIRQMGEEEHRVHNVGSPGIDQILMTPTFSRSEFLDRVGLPNFSSIFLVTLHPATLSNDNNKMAQALVDALNFFPEAAVVITGSNKDPGADQIDQILKQFSHARENAVFHYSLGSKLYFSALRHCSVVIGNSSSGLYEAPSFEIPTVNIGDRQTGRIRAASVLDCSIDVASIVSCIRQALSTNCKGVANPYGDGYTAKRIVEVLAKWDGTNDIDRKKFRDIIDEN